jgi:Trk-type K+ transport system membrane component
MVSCMANAGPSMGNGRENANSSHCMRHKSLIMEDYRHLKRAFGW